jgi:4-hydroxy-tetrahydrodipicolinate synthase
MIDTSMKLRGIVPPIGTPLLSDESVDVVGLRKLVRYLLDSRVNAIFVNGTMGIFALLSDREQLRAIEEVTTEVNGRVPVIAGVSDSGTRRVIEKAKQASALGADYLATVAPYYYRLTQASCIRHYRDVAQAAGRPVFIYNNAWFTKFDLSVDSILELSDEPNIAGIKETNPDCARWRQLANSAASQQGFSVLIGTELLPEVALLLGADGIVGGSHNIAAPVAVALYEAARQGNFNEALKLADRIRSLNRIFQYGEVWGAFEVALNHLGISDKATAGPYNSVSEEERITIEAILKDSELVATPATHGG